MLRCAVSVRVDLGAGNWWRRGRCEGQQGYVAGLCVFFERLRGAAGARKCASWDGRYDDAGREVPLLMWVAR